jgi:putative glutamine amidotransferase
MKKTIGVVYTTETAIKPYLQLIEVLGCNTEIVFAFDENLHQDIDMLLLPGGADVNPTRYHEKPNLACGKPNMQFEWFDEAMLPQYVNLLETKQGNLKGIFGVCRGFQTLNVLFGGSLDQDIPQQYSGDERNKIVDTLVTIEALHDVAVFDNKIKSIIRETLVKGKMGVNSLHHQGFSFRRLSKELTPLLINNAYNNIEAFCHKQLPIVATQWHPEEIFDGFSIKAINLILNA